MSKNILKSETYSSVEFETQTRRGKAIHDDRGHYSGWLMIMMVLIIHAENVTMSDCNWIVAEILLSDSNNTILF